MRLMLAANHPIRPNRRANRLSRRCQLELIVLDPLLTGPSHARRLFSPTGC